MKIMRDIVTACFTIRKNKMIGFGITPEPIIFIKDIILSSGGRFCL